MIPPMPSGELVSDYCYALMAAGRSPRTISQRRRQVRAMLRACGDPLTCTRTDLTRWLATEHWKPSTRAANRAAARDFFAWLTDAELRDDNPAAKLPPVRVPAPVPHPAPEQALQHARDAARDPWERCMVELAARCGLRRREIATLRFDDVLRTDDGPMLRVLGKGNKVRVIPLPEDIAAMIDGLRSPWVFPSRFPGQHTSDDSVGDRLSTLLGPGFSAHSLRHRFATKAYGATHDILAVQQLLGHSSPATTMGYVRVDPADLRRAAGAAS